MMTTAVLDPLGLDLEQTVLIEASAGTGKTYTITTLVTRLVAQGYPVDAILVVTFTEAAAAELKMRIRKRLSQCLAALNALEERMGAGAMDGGNTDEEETGAAAQVEDELVAHLLTVDELPLVRDRLTYAVASFDQACIATIHSFCSLMLKTHTFESGARFETELVTDNSAFFAQVTMDFFMTRINDQDPLFLNFLSQRGVTPEKWGVEFKSLVGKTDLVKIPEGASFREIWDGYRELTGKIRIMVERDMDALVKCVLTKSSTVGLNGNAYRKASVPKWLEQVRESFARGGKNAVFNMRETGDVLYKFSARRMAGKTLKGKAAPHHPFFDLCDELTDLGEILEENLIHLKLEFLSFYDGELAKLKATRGQCFFDDLINDLAAALEDGGAKVDKAAPTAQDSGDREGLIQAAHETFGACLIDEFQDTDPRQYTIFSTLFRGKNRVTGKSMPFFMIGDPKQAIYAFRGGDIFAYLTAAEQCDSVFTLDKNYRSSPSMVQGVNALFANVDNPFLFEPITFTKVGTPKSSRDRMVQGGKALAPLQFSLVPEVDPKAAKGDARHQVARALVDQVCRDLGSSMEVWPLSRDDGTPGRALTPGDMAVLVRSHKQAAIVQEALSRAGIPSYLSKTGSVFDSPQARELYDILAAVQEPGRMEYIRGALCTSVFGFHPHGLRDRDVSFSHSWQERFFKWKETWENRGFVFMLQDLLYSDLAFLRADCRVDERGMTNFHHLMELVSQAALDKQLSMFFLLKWYRSQLAGGGAGDKEQELRLESDGKAVAIVTIHKSKGLEYPVVYLPFLWDQAASPKSGGAVLFHDPDQDHRACLDFRYGEEAKASRAHLVTEDEAEQRRLLYVALTRASALCRIFWGNFKDMPKTSLGGLLHPGGAKTDEGILDDLGALAGEGILCEPLTDLGERPVYTPPEKEILDLDIRPYPPRVYSAFRISSFTAVTRGLGEDGLLPEMPAETLGEDPILAQPVCLDTFPRGSGAGDFFHGVLEEMDFTGGQEEVASWVDKTFLASGFRGQELKEMAVKGLDQVIRTPLDDGTQRFTLGDIPKKDRISELPFHFLSENFNVVRLAGVFKDQPATRAYGEFLEQSPNKGRFAGFINGFIDLVVRVGGKWYILDYKSNYLGSTHGDYRASALDRAMVSHHYILQYHLYLVALDRYLALRLPDYEYGRDMGGVFYLFLRGMHPHAGESGIYFNRPSQEMMVQLSKAL